MFTLLYKLYQKLFGKKETFVEVTPEQVSPDNVEHEDPFMREVIARAFNSGNIIIGETQEDGTLKVTEIKRKKNG